MQMYKTMVPLVMLTQFLKLYLECPIGDKVVICSYFEYTVLKTRLYKPESELKMNAALN